MCERYVKMCWCQLSNLKRCRQNCFSVELQGCNEFVWICVSNGCFKAIRISFRLTPIHIQFCSDWNTHHPSSFIIIGYVHALINPIGMLSEDLFLLIDLVKWRYIATVCYCQKAAGLSSLLQSSEDFFANSWTKDSWLHVSAHFFKVPQVTTPRLCHGFANDLLVIAMLHAGLVDLILGGPQLCSHVSFSHRIKQLWLDIFYGFCWRRCLGLTPRFFQTSGHFPAGQEVEVSTSICFMLSLAALTNSAYFQQIPLRAFTTGWYMPLLEVN